MKYKIGILGLALYFNLSSCLAQENGMPKYLDNKYKAEKFLVSNNFKSAVKSYIKSFKAVDIPNIDDVHNALLASYRSGSVSKRKKLRRIFNKYNYHYKYLTLLSESTSLDFVNYLKRGGATKYECNGDQELFIDLLKLDQEVREKCGILRRRNYNVGDSCVLRVKQVDSLNFKRIYDFIEEYEFPSKNCSDDAFPFKKDEVEIILRHNLMWGRRLSKDILLRSAAEGRVRTDFIAHYEDYYQTNVIKSDSSSDLGISGVLFMNDILYIFPPDAGVEQVNMNRSKFYLENLDLFYEKVKYQLLNKEFKLVYPLLLPKLAMSGNQLKQYEKDWFEFRVLSVTK